MEKEQLEKKLYFALDDLDVSFMDHQITPFKLKEYKIKQNPKWPAAISFFAAKQLQSLQLNNCNIRLNSELWSNIIGDNPVGPCKIQNLNLSNNKIAIIHAKILAEAFEHNKSIQFLDLSNNYLKVYGTHLICNSLMKNNTLKGLSLFNNIIDVDGCRALRNLLISNKNIEYLDIGFNRIRNKGLEAIAEGIKQQGEKRLTTLGIRSNFLNDDSIQKFFDDIIFSGVGKLENLYVKFNNISQTKALDLQQKVSETKMKIYVDEFERVFDKKDEKRKKVSIWIRLHNTLTGAFVKQTMEKFKANRRHVGLVRSMIFRRGGKISGKDHAHNYCFIEFEDENSVKKCMRWMQNNADGISTPYLVGSNTFVLFRRSLKNKRR